MTRQVPRGPEIFGTGAVCTLFLASDESKYITAHELAPDAGVTEF